jgi:hypothetical protein
MFNKLGKFIFFTFSKNKRILNFGIFVATKKGGKQLFSPGSGICFFEITHNGTLDAQNGVMEGL